MWNVVLLGIVSLFADISSEMAYPLIPLYLVAIGAGPAALGLIEGAAETLASLTKVLSGRRSDYTGRRKPLALGGYGLAAVGKAILALGGGWPIVLAGRLADRFGKGIRGAPRDALLVESINPHQRGRAFGLHRAMDTTGALLGVLLAYLVITRIADATAAGYQRVFALAVLPAVASVAVLAFVRERRNPTDATAPKQPTRQSPRAAWGMLDSRLKIFLGLTLLFTLGNSSNQFLLLRAEQLGLDAGSVLLLYAWYNLVYALLSYPAGRLSDRFGRRSLLIAGYAAYGLVYLGFALARTPTPLWGLLGVYGAYAAATDGVEKALLVDLAPESLRATVLGLHATVVGVGLLPASLLAGLMWDWLGAPAAFLIGSAAGVFAAVGLALLLRSSAVPTSAAQG